MDIRSCRSRQSISKFLNDEKAHKTINETLLKSEKDLYEVELLKSIIEHREPIVVGFFILQYPKLRILELYYNFFDKFSDIIKIEEMDLDTDALYLPIAEENLYDCMQLTKRDIWGGGGNEGNWLQRFIQIRWKI